MSWNGGSLYVTRGTVTAGTHAHVFRPTKLGKDHPHITTSKPFEKDGKAWIVRYTGVTNPLYAEEYGWSAHRAHDTAFRSKAHADAWFRVLADADERRQA